MFSGTLFTLLAACEPTKLSPPTVVLSPDVVTVATAEWSDDAGEPTQIEVYWGEEHWLSTDWEKVGAPHKATLVGLNPELEWSARVVGASGSVSDWTAFQTPALPTDFPEWSTRGQPGWEGYMYTASLGSDVHALVLDAAGRVVWYSPGNPGQTIVRARPRRDGRGVVYGETGAKNEGSTPTLRWVNWQGQVEKKLELPNFTHDFIELSDGTLLYTLNDIRHLDGYDIPVWGNALAIWSPDAETRIVWSTWDDWVPGTDGLVAADGEWTHANAMDINADETIATLGFRNVSTIVQIDLASGERIWQLGGEQSDFDYAEPGDRTDNQHQFQWVEDELFIFDNRSPPFNSRGLALSFDETTGIASKTWQWERDPGLWSYVLGDIHRREDDSSMLVFTSAGVIDDIDPEGEVRWELAGSLGTSLSYVTPVDSLPGITRQR